MEYINCILCNNDDTEFLFSKKDKFRISDEYFNVVKCKSCGLIYVNPRPSEDEIIKFYPQGYLWREEFNTHSLIAKLTRAIEANYKYYIIKRECLKIIKIFNIKNPKDYKLLDIGCGTGERLRFFRDLGFSVSGLEVSSDADYAKKYFNLEVIKCNIYQANFQDNYFDIVTIFNVLEHIHNPITFLKEIYRILKDRGFLIVQIPNTDSFQYKIFKKRWCTFDVPRDLFYFNIKQLKHLFKITSFKIVKVDYSGSLLHPSIAMSSIFSEYDPQRVWLEEERKNKINIFKRLIWFLGAIAILPLILSETIFKKSGMITIYLKK